MKKIKNSKELEALRKKIIKNQNPKKPCITVCAGTGCCASGSEEVIKAFKDEINAQKLGKKVDVKSAKRIVLAGVEEAIKLRDNQDLAEILENQVVNINDKLSFYVMGGKIDFIIIASEPYNEPVRITINTSIIISDESYKKIIENKKNKS